MSNLVRAYEARRPMTPDELARALDSQSPEFMFEAEVQVEAAAALRRLARLERENARLLEALNRIGADTCENCIKGEQAMEALEATDGL